MGAKLNKIIGITKHYWRKHSKLALLLTQNKRLSTHKLRLLEPWVLGARQKSGSKVRKNSQMAKFYTFFLLFSARTWEYGCLRFASSIFIRIFAVQWPMVIAKPHFDLGQRMVNGQWAPFVWFARFKRPVWRHFSPRIRLRRNEGFVHVVFFKNGYSCNRNLSTYYYSPKSYSGSTFTYLPKVSGLKYSEMSLDS